MFILIEEIRGNLKVVISKIDSLVESVDTLKQNTVTREELRLTVDVLKADINELQNFRKALMTAGAIILIGVLGLTLSHVIPGFKL